LLKNNVLSPSVSTKIVQPRANWLDARIPAATNIDAHRRSKSPAIFLISVNYPLNLQGVTKIIPLYRRAC
jgi:hypothetical protein